jgi:hypothetical protein
MGMEFGRFPIFLGNGWASGMESGSFGVLSKTFLQGSSFPEVELFQRNVGKCAERVGQKIINSILCEYYLSKLSYTHKSRILKPINIGYEQI